MGGLLSSDNNEKAEKMDKEKVAAAPAHIVVEGDNVKLWPTEPPDKLTPFHNNSPDEQLAESHEVDKLKKTVTNKNQLHISDSHSFSDHIAYCILCSASEHIHPIGLVDYKSCTCNKCGHSVYPSHHQSAESEHLCLPEAADKLLSQSDEERYTDKNSSNLERASINSGVGTNDERLNSSYLSSDDLEQSSSSVIECENNNCGSPNELKYPKSDDSIPSPKAYGILEKFSSWVNEFESKFTRRQASGSDDLISDRSDYDKEDNAYADVVWSKIDERAKCLVRSASDSTLCVHYQIDRNSFETYLFSEDTRNFTKSDPCFISVNQTSIDCDQTVAKRRTHTASDPTNNTGLHFKSCLACIHDNFFESESGLKLIRRCELFRSLSSDIDVETRDICSSDRLNESNLPVESISTQFDSDSTHCTNSELLEDNDEAKHDTKLQTVECFNECKQSDDGLIHQRGDDNLQSEQIKDANDENSRRNPIVIGCTVENSNRDEQIIYLAEGLDIDADDSPLVTPDTCGENDEQCLQIETDYSPEFDLRRNESQLKDSLPQTKLINHQIDSAISGHTADNVGLNLLSECHREINSNSTANAESVESEEKYRSEPINQNVPVIYNAQTTLDGCDRQSHLCVSKSNNFEKNVCNTKEKLGPLDVDSIEKSESIAEHDSVLTSEVSYSLVIQDNQINKRLLDNVDLLSESDSEDISSGQLDLCNNNNNIVLSKDSSCDTDFVDNRVESAVENVTGRNTQIAFREDDYSHLDYPTRSGHCDYLEFPKKVERSNLGKSHHVNNPFLQKSIEIFPNITVFTKKSTDCDYLSLQKSRPHFASWSNIYTIVEESDSTSEQNHVPLQNEIDIVNHLTDIDGHQSGSKLCSRSLDETLNTPENLSVHNESNSVSINRISSDQGDLDNSTENYRQFLLSARRKSTYDTPGIYEELLRLCERSSSCISSFSDSSDQLLHSNSDTSVTDDDSENYCDSDNDDRVSQHSYKSSGFEVHTSVSNPDSDSSSVSHEEDVNDSDKREYSTEESDIFTDDADDDEIFGAPSTFQRFSRNRTSFRRGSIDLGVYGSFRRRSNSIACLCPTPSLPLCTQSLDLQGNDRSRRFSTSIIMETHDDISKSGKAKNSKMTKTIGETKYSSGDSVRSPERKLENSRSYRDRYGANSSDDIPRSSRTGFDREVAGQHLSKVQNSPYLQKYLEKGAIAKYNLASAPRTTQILSDPKIQKYLINRGDGSKALERAIQKPKPRSSKTSKSTQKTSKELEKNPESAEKVINNDNESKSGSCAETMRLIVRRTSSHSDLDKLKDEKSSKPSVKVKDAINNPLIVTEDSPGAPMNGDSSQNKSSVVRSLSCSSPRPEILVTQELDANLEKESMAKSSSAQLGGFSRLRATFLKSKFYIPTFEEFKRRRFGSIKAKKSDVVDPVMKRTASVPLLNDEDQESDSRSKNSENRLRKLSHDPRLSAPNLESDLEESSRDSDYDIPVPKSRNHCRTNSEKMSKSAVNCHFRSKTVPAVCNAKQTTKLSRNELDDLKFRDSSPKSRFGNKMKMFDKSKRNENEEISTDRLTRTRRHKSDLTGTQTQDKISQPKRHKSDVASKVESKPKRHLKFTPPTCGAGAVRIDGKGSQSPVPKPRDRTRRKGTAELPDLEGNDSDNSGSPNVRRIRKSSSSSLKKQSSRGSLSSSKDRSLSKRESSDSLTSSTGDVNVPRRRNQTQFTTDRPVSANLEHIHKSKHHPVRAFQPVSSNLLDENQQSSRSNSATRAERNTLVPKTVDNRLSQSSDCLSISGVTRSTSDVTDIKAEEKRKVKKPRAYKSDPFKTDEQKQKQYLFREDYHGRSNEDLLRTVLSHHGSESLPSLDCDTDISSESPPKRFSSGKKSKKISNVSTTSVDSGVIGHSSSREHMEDYDRYVDGSPSYIEVERVDSGVGYDISKDMRDKYQGTLCEVCDQPIEETAAKTDEINSVCKKCHERRIERKEAMHEIVDTEISYGRDLKLIKEEFLVPMQKSSLLTAEQLQSIFLNLQELIDINDKFSDCLLDALDLANEQGDEDLRSVRMGNMFMDFSFMFIAFENYCVHQASAAVLLDQLEKEKELFRIFLQVSQTENQLLRRMNLRSFLMIPVQRITRYPLLLSRLFKATPQSQDDRSSIRESQLKIEEILEHINSKTKIQGSSVGTRIKKLSVIKKTSVAENIELQKVAFEIIGKNRNEAFCVHMGKVSYAQPTDMANWQKRGKGVKFSSAHGIIIAIGKSKENYNVYGDQLFFPKKSALLEGILVLIKDKGGKYVQSREPLSLEKCVVSLDSEYEDVVEIQDINKDTLLLKADSPAENKVWLQHLKYQAKDLGMWRRRRPALPNIMISKPLDS